MEMQRFGAVRSGSRAISLAFAGVLGLAVWCSGAAFAHGGLSVGFGTGLSPDGAVSGTLRATYPLIELQRSSEVVHLSARADLGITLSAATLPSIGLAGLAGAAVPDAPADTETYLGAGAGLGFSPDPVGAAYLIGGGRMPVAGALHTFWEIQLAIAPRAMAPSIAIGVEYALGGPR